MGITRIKPPSFFENTDIANTIAQAITLILVDKVSVVKSNSQGDISNNKAVM